MAFKTIIDAIHTELDTLVGANVVAYRIGRRYVDEEADGYRVVWVPLSEKSAAQKDVGGVQFAKAGGGNQRQTAITARLVRIATHIWAPGDGFDEGLLNAETLLENLIVAARTATNIGCQFEGASWTNSVPANAGYDVRGEGCVAEWSMLLPVWSETKPLTPITTAHHQGSMQFPGGTYPAGTTTTEDTCSS